MYTLETLIPDCVGRYITNSSGSVQLASLINGRTYAKCWQALVYWIVSQYELGNSTNIAPLGVIVRERLPAGSAPGDAAAKPASFRFFKSFLDKHALRLRPPSGSNPAQGEPVREDDLSTIRMNLATLARLADVEPGTFRVALSHLFRRLGEVLQNKEQVLIDFSVGSLIGDKATVDFLFHHSSQPLGAEAEIAGKAAAAAGASDPRLLHKSGRWKKTPAAAAGARSLLADSKALRNRYPLDSGSGAGSQQQRIQRVEDEEGNEMYLDAEGNQLEPERASALWAAQQQQMQSEEKESGEFGSRARGGYTTNDFHLARLADSSSSSTGSAPQSAASADTLPNSSGGGFQRKLQGAAPLRNVRKLLSGGAAGQPQALALQAAASPALLAAPGPASDARGGLGKVRATRFAESPEPLKLLSPSPPGSRQQQLRSGSPDDDSLESAGAAGSAAGSKRRFGSTLSNLPPVLDSFARTQAATYCTEQFFHSASAKIASFYTPEASAYAIVVPTGKLVHHPASIPFVIDRLELSDEEKRQQQRERLKKQKLALTSGSASSSSSLADASSSSPSTDALDERAITKSLLRYQYYIEDHMSDSCIAPIKEEWIRNGLALLNTHIGALDESAVESLVRSNLLEIKSDYLRSMKQSILDYVLRSDKERARLGIPIRPPMVADWGYSIPPSRPPLSWRAPIQRAYRGLSRNLFRNNPAMLSLLEIWAKYQHLLLVDLPTPAQLPVTLRAFEAAQKAHREKVQLILLNEWGDECEYIFQRYAREENLTDENSAAFFEAVATVMANQLRSIVENSARAFHAFFKAYEHSPTIVFGPANPTMEGSGEEVPVTAGGDAAGEAQQQQPASARVSLASLTAAVAPAASSGAVSALAPVKSLTTILSPTWIRGPSGAASDAGTGNNPRPIFLQKLLVHKLKDSSLKIEYELSLQEMDRSIHKCFDDFVCALDDIPRVENKIFSVLDETKYLALMLEGEGGEEIQRMKTEVLSILQRSTANAAMLLQMYDEYIYLLDEEKRVANYLKNPAAHLGGSSGGGAAAAGGSNAVSTAAGGATASQAGRTAASSSTSIIAGAHGLAEYKENILRYRRVALALEKYTHRSIRTPMILVDCSSVNDLLISKAHDLSTQILTFLSGRHIDKNIHICDKFKVVSGTLLKKPANTKELVELVKYLSNFRRVEREELIKECAAIKEQLRFLYEMDHRVGTDILSHVGASWAWLLRIDTIIKESESLVTSERTKQEHKIEEARDLFTKQLANYASTAKQFEQFGEIKKMIDYETAIHELQRLLAKAEEDIENLHVQEGLLGLTQTDFYQLQQTKAALAPYETLWALVASWEKRKYEWIKGPVFKLDATAVEAEVDEMFRTAFKLAQSLAETAPVVAKVAEEIKRSIQAFKPHVPLLHILCNAGMRDRHWATVSDIIQFELRPDAHTPLNRVLEMSVEQHLDALSEVSEAASKEHAIEKAVAGMKAEWAPIELLCKKWRETGTHILMGDSVEEVQTLLDDHTIKIQTIKGSPFAKPFIDDVKSWEAWLLHTQEIVEVWLKVQSAYVDLEPVFSADDIIKQMPSEGTMFKVVDANWRKLMNDVIADTKVYSVSVIPHVLGILKEAQSLLDTIQTGLNQYLETKRLFFPRFYFLSNGELLEILSETKDPLRVQPHMKKCFEGVHELEFKPNLDITAMHSKEGESVPLVRIINPVDAHGAVERWLSQFELVMKDTVLDQCSKSLKAYAQVSRAEWTADWPGQVVLTVNQIQWTNQVERAINKTGKGALKEFLDKSNAELQFIVMKVRGDLSYLQRCTLGALVVIDVHARDVVEHLIANNVTDVSNFDWQAQLRYYYSVNDHAINVRMINAQIEYGNEGALQLNLGGAPEGPAGTGKTETTKDLAKACAIQCVVFNCSDGLDYMAMGKFFKGLASSGAWSCFDEFNRIDLEVLSVVAQQIQTIQRAKELKVESFVFEGTEIQLKPRCAVFITMNPGYAGRSELPDNLKSQFRTVAMMIPDYGLIAQILLYSMGYVEAQALSRKIVATYKLCSEQLSSQDHYDYGMRAVRAVLTAAQQLKQKYPQEKESVLLLRSITDVNEPKFLSHDIELFHGILSDLFPNVKPQVVDYGALLAAINANCVRMNLQPEPYFITKIFQLYETLCVRHGLMAVGLPMSGKTSAYRVLAAALTDLSKTNTMNEKAVKITVINPKSINSGQLYGRFDPVSHDWTDGVLANKFAEYSRDTSPDRKWLVFDGPVDAIWIENMNTVLDDNKKLCLMSGQIIHMTPSMNCMFEVRDLAVASPATVSRCGMVYMEPQNLGWRCIMVSWLRTLPAGFDEKARKRVETLFDWLVPPCLRVVRAECAQYVPSSDSAMVHNLMDIFDSLVLDSADTFTDPKKVEEIGLVRSVTLIESFFLFALVWSIGASVDAEGRKKFDRFLREVCKEVNHYKLASQFPKKGLVHDYLFGREAGRWVHWSETLSNSYRIPLEAAFQEIIVPTIETARYKCLLDMMLKAKKPALFVGPTGTGKSIYILDTLNGLNKEKCDQIVINFSAQTSANQTQALVDDKLDRRRRGVYGPTGGKTAVLFIDDLNLPKREKYFAQPPIELLRQLLDSGGWYDVAEFQFHHIVDLQLVAAMGPPGGGRNPVTDRLLRHFVSVSLTPFEDSTINLIFSSIMRWHFERFPKFAPTVQALTDKLVIGTRELYGIVTTKLLPTPAKTHYSYNLRDISRVFQGLCMSTPDAFPEPLVFLRLWVHEVHRVFCDRLVNDEDALVFLEGVKTIIKTRFVTDFSKLMAGVADAEDAAAAAPAADATASSTSPSAPSAAAAAAAGGRPDSALPIAKIDPDMEKVRSLFFGDYMSRGRSKEYQEISDIKGLFNVFVNYLEDYNAVTSKPMNLSLFRFAIEHVSRIARILKQPGGHALLVGVGGSGKQSLTRLAASVLEYECMSIELTKSFGNEEWRTFLRKLLRRCGGDGKHTVFLLNDSQIKSESFLEDINGLLNSAQVSNLWPADELAETLELTRTEAKKQKKALGSQQDLMNWFIAQCRSHLHVVLCMSPIGSTFRERLRMFPSLISCCTMSWFSAWPQDALTSVASDFLSDVELDSKTRDACVTMCMYFQRDVEAMTVEFFDTQRRQCYVTPTSYLELLSTFKTLLAAKRKEVTKQRSRYQTGLDKLAQTEKAVKVMQVELENMQPALLRTSVETDEMMVVVSRETEEAQKIRVSVASEEKIATEAANVAKAIERECAADLSEAMPILEAAIAALDTLTPQEIAEIKVMRNPPRGVKLVMEALCVVKKIGPTRIPDPNGAGKFIIDYWEPSKKFILSDPKLLRSLVEYDKDNMDPKVVKKIREFLMMPEFAIDKIKAVSRAAHSLCSWIYAIEAYDRVVKQVEPKKQALMKSRSEYEVVKKSLDAARGELAKVEGKISKLNANLQSMQEEKADLEAKINQCSLKLERAHTLLSRLGGEKSRWTTIAAELGTNYTNLTGDILLSAGVIAYLGPFTAAFRARALAKWSAKCVEMLIPCSPNFSLVKTLGEPVTVRKWVIDGLPNDSFSIDNGIIISKSRRWPLCIDPQSQANRWIKNAEKDNKLVVVKASDDYTRALEAAIQFGSPLLMENVGDTLDPSLDGVLQKIIFKKGSVRCIRVGDADIEFNDGFRLMLTTKMANPSYLPEEQVKVCLLNFQITPEGLEDQLLGIVVAKEKPDLESERSRLIVTSAANASKLKEIEDKILQNILDDSSAIEILSASKAISNEIEEKQKIAAKTEAEIDVSRMGYKPVAFHASVLFFTIADLASIDPMYNYSLGWFQKLFHSAIDSAAFSHALQTRITNLNDYFTYSLYTNVCRSLFAKDRTLFSLLLTSRILQSLGKISADDWRSLLTGGVALDRQLPPNPAAAWLSDKAWAEICRFSGSIDKLRGMHNDFGALQAEWKAVYDSPEPHTAAFPGKLASLDSFSKLLILRCLRPDKIIPACRDFVVEHLGAKFTEVPPFDLAGVFADSATDAPIVFVLSAGSDPMSGLMKFAADRDFADKVSSISLGQGQGPIAQKMIDKAIKDGTWVVLQNAHLAPSWMPALDRLCDGPAMKPQNCHPDFRLWITSYPSAEFPVSILQSAVKLTTESPDGLRQNMLDSYLKDPVSDEKFFVSCKRAAALKNLTFGLAFFHAVVQERRKFGSLGFNIPYGFTDGDFKISVRQLHMFLDSAGSSSGAAAGGGAAAALGSAADDIPYKALSYIIGEVNYGGRVTDDWDRRTLLALLSQFITPAIHAPNYPLSASGLYTVPPSDGPQQSYIDAIRQFPLTGAPELFGLHENADITKDAAQTAALFSSILLTEAGSSGGKEASKNKILDEVSQDILKKLPPRFDIPLIQTKYPVQYNESMNTVLVQECIRYTRLCDVVRTSLASLRKALVGEVVMSKELEVLASSMFDGVIPEMWAAVSYPSLKPLGSYVTDLVSRLKFLQDWIEHDVPTLVHLPALYFTQSFLTGVLQNYARSHKVAIDDVAFDFEFLSPEKLGEKPARPENGAYVKGLYLEGARWDFTNNRLAESNPKVLFTPAPIIWLKPCRTEDLRAGAAAHGGHAGHGGASHGAAAGNAGGASGASASASGVSAASSSSSSSSAFTFDCPMYRTTARRGVLSTTGHSTNFVMSIRLPSNEPPNHWVQRGVALIAQLSE